MTGSKTSGLASCLSLFTSLSTLACCALPSLLVLLGLGTTVASVLTAAPWLVALSRHKLWAFLFSGLIITGNFLYLYFVAPRLRWQAEACSADDPNACETVSRFSRGLLWISAAIYLAGLFVSYLLRPILMVFES